MLLCTPAAAAKQSAAAAAAPAEESALHAAAQQDNAADTTTASSNLPNPTHAGYLEVERNAGSKIYYQYYEADEPSPSANTPIILWLQVCRGGVVAGVRCCHQPLLVPAAHAVLTNLVSIAADSPLPSFASPHHPDHLSTRAHVPTHNNNRVVPAAPACLAPFTSTAPSSCRQT